MNERLANVGEQLKQAFERVRDAWKAQEAARKKLIIGIAVGLVVFAIGLVIILSVVNNRFVELYPTMDADETVTALSVLENAQLTARINDSGHLEVPSKEVNRAMGQLSLQGIPRATLDYAIFQQATGLTTTEFEKKEYRKLQLQNRMQDIIKTLDGIRDAQVTLNIEQDSTRVWDANRKVDTGSVTLHAETGYTITTQQVQGIRFLVGSSTGIEPENITVTDSAGVALAAGGDAAAAGAGQGDILERLGVAEYMEAQLEEKARTIMSLPYPDASKFEIVATVRMDWDKMVTEIMQYDPLEGTNHGVLDDEEIEAVLGLQQYVSGVVGETDNTDVPIYVDRDGDEALDDVNMARFRDYAVSYTMKQIEKDGPSLESAMISIVINGVVDNQTRQDLRDSVSKATGIPIEDVGVNGFVVVTPEPPPVQTWIERITTQFNIPAIAVYIAIAAVFLLILILILVLVIRSKIKKKRLAAELAAAEAEQLEAERIQQEIEERKQQLKNAAIGDVSEDAISNEVRDFARHNPEITANLLRNWLKDD